MRETPAAEVWKRSSRCSDSACVEVARHGDVVRVRNSSRPDRVIEFSGDEWTVFREAFLRGEF